MAPEVLSEILQSRALPYNSRTNLDFSSKQVHSEYHVTK